MEVASAAANLDPIAGQRTLAQIVGHRAVRQQANQEFHLGVGTRRMCERVAAPLIATWHFELRELAGLEIERLR